jgi:hypothetical protein
VKRALAALVVVGAIAGSAHADRPITTYVPRPADADSTVNSNIIYLNNCEPSGCVVRFGNDNSTTDSSSLGQGTLQAFNSGDTVWQQVVACVQDVFYPFNVQIVTTRPASGSYLEIMVAGAPQNVGMSGNIGGVAPFKCQPYQQNALVFDFANVWGGNVNDICQTAAQEIAHTWSLDHSTDAMDPMTYFTTYGGRKYYQNTNQQCGSDCVNGTGPFGQTCTGQNHACACTGAQTQNDYSEILALFGASTPTPPVVKITNPMDGANVQPGFPVVATVDTPYGASKAELRVDGQLVLTLTSQPFAFNAPTTLGDGSHTVQVTGYDSHNNSAMAMITVYIGKPCTKPADCPLNTDTCIGGRCVPGPGTQGGLGMACTNPTQCASGMCDSDGMGHQYCVDTCTTGQCPSGFGCEYINSTDPTGVCWPGYNDGSGGGGGGCATGGRGGPFVLGLTALASLLALRRRRA